jgi:hypothetical protein
LVTLVPGLACRDPWERIFSVELRGYFQKAWTLACPGYADGFLPRGWLENLAIVYRWGRKEFCPFWGPGADLGTVDTQL